MARSVSFANELVSELHYVPRLCKDKISDYFYSREDIDRFQRIWKSIILQRMKQLESDGQEEQNATKRTRQDDMNNKLSATCAKRRRFTAEKQGNAQSRVTGAQHVAVQAVRSVSPVEQVDSR